METKCPVIGVDVAKKFSYYCILDPDGKVYRNSFKATNDLKGLRIVLKEMKKAEKEFGLKPVIILESTGHYSNPLVHFFTKKELTVLLVNPLQSHSIKNSHIRKIKNDKVDARELAELYFLRELKPFEQHAIPIENLRLLSRTYANVAEQRVTFINQLTASVEQMMPRFTKLFSDIASKTSLALLEKYTSPSAILAAPEEEIIQLIRIQSRRSLENSTKKYKQLIEVCMESQEFGVSLQANDHVIKMYSRIIIELQAELKKLDNEISKISKEILAVELIKSIPGIGETIAPVIVAEIGDIRRFKSAKQLIAYCGIDPTVRQSGNFVGTKNRFTKRGSRYMRRALYIAATVSIRKGKNGKLVNPIMHEYYQKKIQSKPKKKALGAVMNKLVRIIYSVLKNNRKFVFITPEEQVQMYQSNLTVAA